MLSRPPHNHFSTNPSHKPTTLKPTMQTFRPVIITVTTTTTKPPYTGSPTYKPTYKPGFHLTPTPLPSFPTTSTTTRRTTENPYRPTFKPAVLATFRPTLPWFSTTAPDKETTTARNPLPTYPFPILPQFDPSSTTSVSFVEDTTTTSTTPATTSSTEPASVGVAGLDGVAVPASPEAFIFYIDTMTQQITDLIAPLLPGLTDQEDTAQSFAAVSTVIGDSFIHKICNNLFNHVDLFRSTPGVWPSITVWSRSCRHYRPVLAAPLDHNGGCSGSGWMMRADKK